MKPHGVQKAYKATEVVRDAGGQATTQEVAGALGISTPTALRYCRRAVELGLLAEGEDRTQPPLSPPGIRPAIIWIAEA